MNRMIPLALLALLLAGLLASEAIAQSCPPPFLLAWGDPGTPLGLAVDASGNIYIANGGWRIQVFDANGVFLRQWGTNGTADGQFTKPEDVAIDAQGYVYVTDSGRERVQKFTSSGTFVTKWGTAGSGNGQFQVGQATGIAINQQGVVYVSEALGSRVQEFTNTGAYVGTLGTQGLTFTDPNAVDVDASGRIYVACDGDASIHVVASDGTPVCAWGSAGSGDGQFGSLGGLAVGASGNVYVSDFGNNRVEKFGDVPTATLRPSWGKLRTLYR